MNTLKSPHRFKNQLSVIFLLLAIAIGYSLNTLSTPKLFANCRIDSCETNINLENMLSQGNLNESINFSFSITNRTRFTNKFNIQHQGSPQLVEDGQGRYLLIPMRNGSSKYTGIVLPKVNSGNLSLTLKILNSQTFYLYKDKAVIYSHRYQLPAFYVSDLTYLNKQLNNQAKNFSDVRISLYKQKSMWRNFQLLEFIFLAILLGVFASKNVVQSFKYNRKKRIPYSYWPLALVTLLWCARVFVWILSPRDPTGATSLTPFGPSGPYFSDIFQVIQVGQTNRPYDLQASTYPPIINAFAKLFFFVPPSALVFGLLIATSAFWAKSFGAALAFAEGNIKIIYYLTFIFSLPILFGLFRGNLDLLASGLISVGVVSILRDKHKSAIIPFGVAVALKYWPALIVVFFVRKIGWKPVIQIAALSTGLSIASTIIIGYHKISEVLHGILVPLLTYSGTNSTNQIPYSYSMKSLLFFAGIFLKARNFIHPTLRELALGQHFFSPADEILIIFVLIAILFFLTYKTLNVSSILLFGAAASLLSTGTSYTYRAAVLLIVLLARIYESENFLRPFNSKSETRLVMKWFRVLEGLSWVCILAPIDFLYGKNSSVSIESLFQPLALIFLCITEGIFVLKENPALASKTRLKLRSLVNLISNWDKIE